ncbi:MAG: hypothetical protein APZ16_03685 [Candidatus Hadarchaeum yellowstonense]|uniref:HTH crp-type domain-containing protein n=1 Tax=Hadarchaeum yellowstonense TaxID=1776334 RepID=A0A147JZU5_HADYE|nr:MAG: hypothetical protein APZ16_03685 [Candidatus Hadarchaeum yellowstonense]
MIIDLQKWERMKKKAIRVFQSLLRGPATVREIANEVGLSYPAAAVTIKDLIKEGLCERKNGQVVIRHSAKAQALIKVLSRYRGEELLGGNREKVLGAITSPKTVKEIAGRARLSEQTVYRLLRELKGMLAVGFDGKKYFLRDEDLKAFLEQKLMDARTAGEETGVVILHSNGFTLKRAPKGARTRGAPTAFSRFAEYGVDYGAENRDFFIDPPREVGLEEILVHALLASENSLDRTMCAVLYLKNRGRIDLARTRRLARTLGILDRWLDLESLCRGAPLRRPEDFLPWQEFVEKAAVYGVEVSPPGGLEEVYGVFQRVGGKLKRKISAYCFGETILMLAGLKERTKDIDLAVERVEDFQEISGALGELGYRSRASAPAGEPEPSDVLVHPELPRIDLFTGRICRALGITRSMRESARKSCFGKLEVNFLPLEAVLLLKAVTGREGDLSDMEAIIRSKIDWRLFERIYWEEIESVGGQFCFTLLEALEILQERTQARVPALRRVFRHCLEEGVRLAVEMGARSVPELKRYLDFPEMTLRRAAMSLARGGKIRLIRRGRRLELLPA